jgi:acyl dehydratase
MSLTVQVGDALADTTILVTPALVVGGAIASRDFEDVHHDAAAAAAKGLPGVICNIHTSNGLLSNYVLGALGGGVQPVRQSVRLVTPCVPGDELRFSGSVVARTEATVTVEAQGATARGVHVAGRVELRLEEPA